jgi:hypothetical protein
VYAYPIFMHPSIHAHAIIITVGGNIELAAQQRDACVCMLFAFHNPSSFVSLKNTRTHTTKENTQLSESIYLIGLICAGKFDIITVQNGGSLCMHAPVDAF